MIEIKPTEYTDAVVAGATKDPKLIRILKEVYLRGYNEGKADCLKDIKKEEKT